MKEKQTKKFLIKVGNHDKLVLLSETNDLKEAKDGIDKYIKENISHCYYTRVIYDEMNIWIDYGRYTDFIYVYFLDSNAKKEYIDSIHYKC